MKFKAFVSFFSFCLAALSSCQNESYTPKPRGYFKIDFPEKEYYEIDTGCPYTFEIPQYSKLISDHSKEALPCWKNLDFPEFNARLHISYFKINETIAKLDNLTEDARKFVFKHTSKATAIDQKTIKFSKKNIYGLEYYIRGNTASNIQFYLTDSTENYLRAALYFNEKPNLDSIQPVLEFIQEDIDNLIDSFAWK